MTEVCGDEDTAEEADGLLARMGRRRRCDGLSRQGEQQIVAPVGVTNQSWHHVAVVLPSGATYAGALYMDGLRWRPTPP